jgi:hypothetical protein
MHKLIILFGRPSDSIAFLTGWQAFLHMAEQMPGLRREAVSLIESVIYAKGEAPFKIHEFYFDDRAALDAALADARGKEDKGVVPRGRITEIVGPATSGKVTLAEKVLVAAHRERHALVAWLDPSRTCDPDYLHRCGVDLRGIEYGALRR